MYIYPVQCVLVKHIHVLLESSVHARFILYLLYKYNYTNVAFGLDSCFELLPLRLLQFCVGGPPKKSVAHPQSASSTRES